MKNRRKPRMRHPPFDDDPCKRLKDYDLRACTWNVRTLNWESASAQLVDVLRRLKADITAIQEVRWTGQGRKKVGPCDIYYSGHIKERKYGVGFVVGERLRRRVLAFTLVDERLATIRIKARFFNISLICAHAPTEEKDDVTKEVKVKESGPNIDSDHYLVAAKIRTRLCAAKNARQQTQGRFDVEKLQSQQTATKYSTRLALLLSESTHQHLGIRELWNGISNSLRTAAAETIGFRQRQKTSWYDEECRLAAERKQTAYLATLQTTTTRARWDRYRDLKREARRICRQKKKEAEMREYEELEKLADRGNARKFYEKMKRLNEGFKTGASSCRDQGGNLVTDVQGILGLWREHFSDLLNGSESTTPGDGEPDPPIDDDGTDVPLPDHEEIRIAITRLKNNKAAGADRLPAELFKYGGEELIRCMHQLLCRIWSEESMPDDWNLSVL
ncbi:uncharacterized protein LOC128921619 [Zeugodacus cucurbitae]|uniref:uncharacterized protein LOC128921619 n=1 Tax=Zeugodacus cucurbitae TaxID=28588 RepID=UPI0023D91788|nr:uncharacterized protein LOC128921619 [Zeugodacus cucurbitae]